MNFWSFDISPKLGLKLKRIDLYNSTENTITRNGHIIYLLVYDLCLLNRQSLSSMILWTVPTVITNKVPALCRFKSNETRIIFCRCPYITYYLGILYCVSLYSLQWLRDVIIVNGSNNMFMHSFILFCRLQMYTILTR